MSLYLTEGQRSGVTNEDSSITERKNSMPAVNLEILEMPFRSDEGRKAVSHFPMTRMSVARPSTETELEERLWKVCAKITSSRVSRFEWIVFLFFGVMALGATINCWSELFQLLRSASLEHLVRFVCSN
jgi:hypothetical protein